MREVIITTLGHVDHGKTSLIYSVTGRDTDTLKEEKERGMSIDLGFTYIDLPSKARCGIIDVPGHEKYMKNMLAGIFNGDLVLLVIDINEGIMPQTKEHIEILKLLEIKNIIVVITKIDIVEERRYKEVKASIIEYLNEVKIDSDIVEYSSITKEGYHKLISLIDRECKFIIKENKDESNNFYLWVDRVFSVKGHGTVVTGTFKGQGLNAGDRVVIYPKNIEARIRMIENHKKKIHKVDNTKRIAVNLSGIYTKDINRGDVIGREGSVETSFILELNLKYIGRKQLKNHQRVRFHHGTGETLGRIKTFRKTVMDFGEEEMVKIILEKEVPFIKGEKFIIRSYSPQEVIGGGSIIKAGSKNLKRERIKEKYVYPHIENKNPNVKGEIINKSNLSKTQRKLLQNIENFIEIKGLKTPKISTYLKENQGINHFEAIFNLLLEEEKIIKLNEDYMVSSKNYYNYKIKIEDYLKNKNKINIEQGKQILGVGRKFTVAFFEYLDKMGITKRTDNYRELNL